MNFQKLPKIFSLFALLLLLLATHSVTFAQSDSTKKSVVIDIVHMKDGTVHRGEIISFNENNGTIVFKDTFGRKFTFVQADYKYYEENVVIQERNKKPFELRPRKESGLEVGLGMNISAVNFNSSFEPDSNYIYTSSGGYYYIHSNLKLSAGKYLNRQNFIGGVAEIGVSNGLRNYFSVGARYFNQYDGYKSNVGFYVPIEVKFTSFKETSRYEVVDTWSTTGGGLVFPITSDKDIEAQLTTVQFSIGHGFAFILHDKKSIQLELSYSKHFVLQTNFLKVVDLPKNSFTVGTLGISAMFNF